jgi:hypothetical protein
MMPAFNPANNLLQHILQFVRAAESVYARWQGNNSHFTYRPKECLYHPLSLWVPLQPLYLPQDFKQRLAPHFDELAACRQMLSGNEVSEDDKPKIITRVNACLTQLRAEIESQLESMAAT